MKTKIKVTIAILASLLLLASCKASPDNEARNMTSTDYKSNKNTIERVDVAKAYIGMAGISSAKGLSIDNQAKTIAYTIDEPIGIDRSELIGELPLLATFLPQTSDFYIISGNASISFAGFENFAKAKSIDDVFKVASMNLVFADNKEGTLNRTVVSISYEGGVGTLKINGAAYSLLSLEKMEEYADSLEDVIETLLKEKALRFDQESKTFLETIAEFGTAIGERAEFTINYEDIEEDERFIIEGSGAILSSIKDGTIVYSLNINGKLTDSEDDELYNIVDANFALKLNAKIGKTYDFELQEASIAGTAIWDSLFDQIESDL